MLNTNTNKLFRKLLHKNSMFKKLKAMDIFENQNELGTGAVTKDSMRLFFYV